ncbi:hypothetical protein AB0H42_10670 [Nocardia sp. NPDC050799]|uniref:hypothetical protein n=1 Tax=Nocardia sp. NPDC050799 TaxID=3154842 RepID=UPI0033C266A7
MLQRYGRLLGFRIRQWSDGYEHELRDYSGVVAGAARSYIDSDYRGVRKVVSGRSGGATEVGGAALSGSTRRIADLSDLPPLGTLVDGAFSGRMDSRALTEAVKGLERPVGPYVLRRVYFGRDTNDFGEEKLYLDADITDHDGTHVGSFSRSFRRDGTGDLVVTNEYMKLKESYQRKGFARALSSSLHEYYRRSGVVRVEVKTELDGGVVWAKEGYQWNTRRDLLADSLQSIRARIDAVIDSGTVSPDDGRLLEQYRHRLRVDSESIPSPAELAALTGHDPHLGETIMKGSQWHGVLYL